ncbi:hypothetical protein K8I28_10145 [bacterium]|nr:hypothetical protein [bacterium]
MSMYQPSWAPYEKEVITIDHFLNLSMEINYHLTARKRNPRGLLALILGRVKADDHQRKALLIAIEALFIGYGSKTRKLGPLAVIHPLRTTALLNRTMADPHILDILGALLHDKIEDIDHAKLTDSERVRFDAKFDELLDFLGEKGAWYLNERIDLLTRHDDKEPDKRIHKNLSYIKYLSRLLDHVKHKKPELLHVKLIDRLDNTMDTHIHRPGVTKYNFYRTIFDILFVPSFKRVEINEYHFLPGPEEGGRLLSQLFKNVTFMTMIRKAGLENLDSATTAFFQSLAVASIREAQWIAIELFAMESERFEELRDLMNQIREYCIGGGISKVEAKEEGEFIDGTMIEHFAVSSSEERTSRLTELYNDKRLLTSVIIAFIATFSSFLNDENFTVDGIESISDDFRN